MRCVGEIREYKAPTERRAAGPELPPKAPGRPDPHGSCTRAPGALGVGATLNLLQRCWGQGPGEEATAPAPKALEPADDPLPSLPIPLAYLPPGSGPFWSAKHLE